MPENAVATPHREATAAARDAFAAGGNAIDAALAAAAVLTVAYPHNCALGGDLFALVRTPDGRTINVNASGPAGSRADPGALRSMPVTGPATVTVPGLVAGWGAVHGAGARLPWADALAPATALAADGVAVAGGLAAAIADQELIDPGMAAIFAPRGTPLAAGETLAQPALARTLRELAEAGPDAFYSGPIGQRLLAGFAGGWLTPGDLREFAPEIGEPLRGRFRDADVLTSPPNSSGVLLLQALAALDRAGVTDPLGADAALLARIFRTGARTRDRRLGDPRTTEVDVDAWLGEEALEAALAPQPERVETAVRPGGDTVAVVTRGADGSAVSLIQSLFHSFGARILEPSTGILLHNRGAMFSLDPGHPNALSPGRRPAHTLMPVLVERAGELLGVLGTMGGKVHAQILVPVLLRLLAGAGPQDAVDAPRWIVGAMELGEPDDMIRIEDGSPTAARTALADAGLPLLDEPRGSDFLGHAQAVWGPTAGSDFRADP
jgi:gamma-glutamyltranspeptidase/glutathione hydrolase